MKKCSKCGVPKTPAEFHNDKSKKDGKNSWCKTCVGEVTSAYRSSHRKELSNKANARRVRKLSEDREGFNAARRDYAREYTFRRNLSKLYGLTLEEYLAIRKAQNERCPICGNGLGHRAAVDHCHATKKVRGVLCNKCNRGIGLLDDDPALLRAAADYLESRKDAQS